MTRLTRKDGFILYNPHYSMIEDFPDEVKGDLLNGIFQYQMTGKYFKSKYDNKYGYAAEVAFKSIKNQFDIDDRKYQKKCETNSETAQKRWHKERANVCEDIQSHTNYADKEKEKAKYKEKNKVLGDFYSENEIAELKHKLPMFMFRHKRDIPIDEKNFLEFASKHFSSHTADNPQIWNNDCCLKLSELTEKHSNLFNNLNERIMQ